MESKRQQKFSKMIQRELSDVFQKEMRHHFGNSFITVTDVEISPDLSFSKVYLSFMLVENKAELLAEITDLKSEIRKHLGMRIGKIVRIVPEINFYLDETLDQAERINNLLKDIEIPEENDDRYKLGDYDFDKLEDEDED
ncbi:MULTISPECIES: 30S ribosome-binding factor RbfA [Persicobacter]|uniref:Ribosome-binding factor A n=1 Tax=Persicobacter diffluens TaxID=981 RepID=A0AAN4VU55_9BACT|nr:30S ribosome-binding factor RbfA [Persicobacter sp. CCB-QB2]GJM59467.1 ribosome-binding factor A [Persicobacter diffluens]